MKGILIIMLLFTGSTGSSFAQWPQYWMTDSLYHTQAGAGGAWFIGATSEQIKRQWIYYCTDFPKAPTGNMSAIYLRVGAYTLKRDKPVTIYGFKVRMGYTNLDSFTNSPAKPDTFQSVKIVFDAPAWFIPNADTLYKWIKIPLQPNSFKYYACNDSNGKKDNHIGNNFIVEWDMGPQASDNVFYPRNYYYPGPIVTNIKRGLLGNINDITTNQVAGNILALGFDIGPPIPTEVASVSKVTSVTLFPNPSAGRRFHVSIDARQTVNHVSVTISDVTGRQMLSQHYSNVGSSFLKELSLADAAAGMYFVKVQADGEVFTRSLLLE